MQFSHEIWDFPVIFQSIWMGRNTFHEVCRDHYSTLCALQSHAGAVRTMGWCWLFGLLLFVLKTLVIWLVVWNMAYFPIQLGIIIPIDFHIFQRVWNHQPVNITMDNVVLAIIHHPFLDGLSTHLYILIRGMVFYCYTNMNGHGKWWFYIVMLNYQRVLWMVLGRF